MRFASLGSGSRGNALVVEAGGTRVLLDCGFSLRETSHRLARLGLAPGDLSAIFITHEHSDHVSGAFKLARALALPAFLSAGTRAAVARHLGGDEDLRIIDGNAGPIVLKDLEVQPFSVPHDAQEPLQYVFSDGRSRLGVLTDVGHITPHVRKMLDGVEALVLECNHDPELLAASDYPFPLKRRVGGKYGHLANAEAAGLLQDIDVSGLRHVVAAHLSEQNNRPELAAGALAQALGCSPDWIGVADQAEGFSWRDL